MMLTFDIQFKGISSIIGAVAIDMGVLTTPQLHWMVRATNKSTKASELDYFDQLSSSFRLVRARGLYGYSVFLNELCHRVFA